MRAELLFDVIYFLSFAGMLVVMYLFIEVWMNTVGEQGFMMILLIEIAGFIYIVFRRIATLFPI